MDRNELNEVRAGLYKKIVLSGGKHAAREVLYIAAAVFVLIIGARLAFAAMERHMTIEEMNTIRARARAERSKAHELGK